MKMTLMKAALLLFLSSALTSCHQSEFKEAIARWDAETLTVSTGKIERSWKFGNQGLVTTGIIDLKTGRNWADPANEICDWAYYGLTDGQTEGHLRSVKALHSDDDGFTSGHLAVCVEYEYPDMESSVRYEIRAYPKAEGLFTRLSIKGAPSGGLTDGQGAEGPEFKLISGKEKYEYKLNGLVPEYFAGYTFSKQEIEYLISGMEPGRAYKARLTFCNPNNETIFQQIHLSSVDGEYKETIDENWKLDGKQGVNEVVFDIPAEALAGESFRLFTTRNEGPAAVLSEIVLYGKGGQPAGLAGNQDRLLSLTASAPEGYQLAGYLNCGKADGGASKKVSARVDFLPVDATAMTRRYFGYNNDTQHRNEEDTPLLKESVSKDRINGMEKNWWASGLCIGDGQDALIIVKESHKCVNQYGHDTGNFTLTGKGIEVTGSSILPAEILPDRYRTAWATWTIVAPDQEAGQQLALKSFERKRFPVHHDSDVYIMANCWGSERGNEAANEANILHELELQKDLGIDVQQIDDGYFKAKGDNAAKNSGFRPHPDKFPEGFGKTRRRAEELGMKLGLWFPATPVSLEEMEKNHEDGNFMYYKLDFANLNSHNKLESLIGKVRKYEKFTGNRARVNWDVTENAPRVGYFWGKEYGCVYLENRKPLHPVHSVYVPHLVLRDLWHLSRYCNLNKFQGTIQNNAMCRKEMSDAWCHSYAYTTAIPLMSTPLFFMETQFYTDEARKEVRPVIAAYKTVRHDLYDCIVFPVGQEPDNASWSGFQAIHPDGEHGYLNLFREIRNQDTEAEISLNFLSGREVEFTDLLTGVTEMKKADPEGRIRFEILQPGDFRMYSWKIYR